MEDIGVVVKIRGNLAEVLVTATGLCEKCNDKNGCAMEGLGGKQVTVDAINKVGAKVGDKVLLSTKSSSQINGALLGFGLPAVGIVVGAMIGQRYGNLCAITGAVSGLIVPLFVLWALSELRRDSFAKLYPQIEKVIS